MKQAADLYEKAIEDYTHAIKFNLKHPHAYRNRANAKFRLGNYEAAIIDLDKAVQIDPENAKILLLIAGLRKRSTWTEGSSR